MTNLDIVIIENLAIQYLEKLNVEYEGPVVINGYDDEDSPYYTIVFRVDASFERAVELCWDFTELIVDRDLDALCIFVDFIGKSGERIRDA